jgi:hypothetical protein
MDIRRLLPARRWLVLLGVFVVLGAGLLYGLSAYSDWKAKQDWADACAEADRLDPGWRWRDLVANRPALPAGRNSVTHIAEAARLLKAMPKITNCELISLTTERSQVAPQHRLTPEAVADLRAMFVANPAVAEIQRIADCPTGQMPLPAARVFVPSPTDELDPLEVNTRLLTPRLALLAEDGDMDGALEQVRLIIYASRPSAECPTEMSTLVAAILRASAARGVERVLGQGEPSPAALMTAIRLLETELGRARLLPGFRGLRAHIEEIVRSLDDATVERQLAQSRIFADPNNWTGWQWADNWLGRLTGADFRLRNAVAMLRYCTQIVEWLKESPDGLLIHKAEHARLITTVPNGAAFMLISWSCYQPIEERAVEAQFRCAAVALAAELFRRETSHWPAALAELTPKYLSAVPRDPFDLQPLRLARRADGIVIYSVGENGTDEGGAISADGAANPTDIGIRLWDVDKRRQPPLPPTAAPMSAGGKRPQAGQSAH